MNPLRVIKVDNQFAIINPGQEIPPAGSNFYHKTASGALRTTLDIVNDHIDDGGALPGEIEVIISEDAPADLIRSFGFIAIEDYT